MKKRLNLFMVAIVGIVFLSGCQMTGGKDQPCSDPSKEVKIGVVTDSGGIHDKSFNQGTWEGVEEYCANSNSGATFKESNAQTEYVPNLQTLSDTEGIEVVIAIGETLSNAVYEVASKTPEIDYILIDGEPKTTQGEVEKLENVKSYLFNEEESGYLVGYIAGKTTQTNQIGFVGGMEITPVQKFGWGFVQGVKEANPDASVNYQYSGSFTDAAKGGQIADQMFGQGVDIVFTCAGETNNGVLNSAKKATQAGTPVSVIGVDRDMYEDGKYGDKSVILTSAIKNVGEAANKGLTEKFTGELNHGTTVLGYKDGGVGIPEVNPNLEGQEAVITEAKKALETKKVVNSKEETEKAIGDFEVKGTL